MEKKILINSPSMAIWWLRSKQGEGFGFNHTNFGLHRSKSLQAMIFSKHLKSLLWLNCQRLIYSCLNIICVVCNASIIQVDLKHFSVMNTPPIARFSSFTTQQEVGLKPLTQVLFPHCARKFVVVRQFDFGWCWPRVISLCWYHLNQIWCLNLSKRCG
jgi:hypothetical protein